MSRKSSCFFTWLLFASLFSGLTSPEIHGQVRNTIDLSKYPSQWVLKPGEYPMQWKELEPIKKEHERAFPSLPDGLYLTFFTAFGKMGAAGPGTPKEYIGTLMVKEFEYISSRKLIKPEGETGCWIYFSVNGMASYLPGQVNKIMYRNNMDYYLYVCNLRTETDANGNKMLYSTSIGREDIPEGWYFSYNQQLPIRKLTRRELFTVYFTHTSERQQETRASYEKNLEKDQKNYDAMSAEQKKQESYWPELLDRNRKELAALKEEMAKLKAWYDQQLKRPDVDQPAVVENLFENIEVEKLDVKKGFHVWRVDPEFYDSTKPKDKAQFIFLKIRPQLGSVPKERYIKMFRERFNLNVPANMVGDKTSTGVQVNTIDIGNREKTETKMAQQAGGILTMNFEKDTPGSPPSQWRGMQNNLVANYKGNNWLAFTKPGYCYPRQHNRPIADGFELSFQLEWNKDISYYTGVFMVSFAGLPYDNALQGFRADNASMSMNSFYDGYVAGFGHMTLLFDPHFNSGGSLQVIVRDAQNKTLFDKKIILPEFFTEKNSHQLKITRKGNSLLVMDNGKQIADIPEAFASNLSYNAYVFSRYTSNNDGPADAYFLNNVSVKY